MPKKVLLRSVGVTRDGKTVQPPLNKLFDFTDDEVAAMDEAGKAEKVQYYRDPINEGGEEGEGDQQKNDDL